MKPSRTGVTNREVTTTVGGGALQYTVVVPAGIVVAYHQGGQSGAWLVEGGWDKIEGCSRGSIARWDAQHRGIVIEVDAVTEDDR